MKRFVGACLLHFSYVHTTNMMLARKRLTPLVILGRPCIARGSRQPTFEQLQTAKNSNSNSNSNHILGLHYGQQYVSPLLFFPSQHLLASFPIQQSSSFIATSTTIIKNKQMLMFIYRAEDWQKLLSAVSLST